MLKPWAENLLKFIYIFGAIGTIISVFFLPRPNYISTVACIFDKIGNMFISKILAFLRVWLVPLLAIVASLISILAINLWGKVEPPPPTPSPHLTETPPATIESPTPSPYYFQTKVDEMDPLIPNSKAFFFHMWDEINEIEVGKQCRPLSIGVKIPKASQDDYYANHDKERITHSEYIEFPLSYQFDKLHFFYGIDDSSYQGYLECSPQCWFWIVVQSCNSEESLGEKDNIIFKSKRANYRSAIHSSGDIDVSGAEAIRITVYWEFDVIQTKPLALNIAIINPTLYSRELIP